MLLEEMVCNKNVLKTYLYLAVEFVILTSGQYSLYIEYFWVEDVSYLRFLCRLLLMTNN